MQPFARNRIVEICNKMIDNGNTVETNHGEMYIIINTPREDALNTVHSYIIILKLRNMNQNHVY